MPSIHKAKGLVPMLVLLLLLPSQVQAANTAGWMTPSTGARYLVVVNSVPNTPVISVANWTILRVSSANITIEENGLLGVIGALGVSLISSGSISLLSAHVVLNAVYNLTSRLCIRPCQLVSPREHAWEWIPSSNNSSLIGQDFDILSTTFEVVSNSTLTTYNRTAWQLKPLIDVYSPSVLLYNFWYDRNTGILLQADLYVGGTGNLTISLDNSTPNLGVQNFAAPLTPAQLSTILLSTLAAYALIGSRARLHVNKRRIANS